ncbi:Gag pol protein [Elysia marginata]|uniref:Gag pol protein n=1 Tax=Elysia marginata TaxID=1093978 RepID=A0AAV4ERP1_9GAST|nr:Gag pol protein [Elysia marginata]
MSTAHVRETTALDTNTTTRALSLLTAPPPSNKYGALKEFFISAFGLTDEERASTLLDLRGLGDYKPSELMDNMLSLLGGHTPCFLFKFSCDNSLIKFVPHLPSMPQAFPDFSH